MTSPRRAPSAFQRNALAPSLIAAATLFIAPVLLERGGFTVALFVAAIFSVIVAWFAIQARHWWWAPVFIAIAVIWNPVFPFAFTGIVWTVAQPVAAVLFLIAGATIKVRRA